MSFHLLTTVVFVLAAEERAQEKEKVKDYQEQLKQMLRDLVVAKDKNAHQPLPLMKQVQLKI